MVVLRPVVEPVRQTHRTGSSDQLTDHSMLGKHAFAEMGETSFPFQGVQEPLLGCSPLQGQHNAYQHRFSYDD